MGYYNMANTLALWVSPIILLLGLLGNVINIIVLHSDNYKSTYSWRLVLTFLAVADLCNLLLGLLPLWIGLLLYGAFSTLYYHTKWLCKFVKFFENYASHLMSWTTVLVSIDRVLAIAKPFDYPRLCAAWKIVLGWLIICTVFLLTDIVIFYLFDVIDVVHLPTSDTDQTIFAQNSSDVTFQACITSPYNDDMWDSYMTYNLVVTFLPFFGILIANLFIIKTMYKSRKNLAAVTQDRASIILLNSTTAMLITMALTYLLLTTPKQVFKMGLNEAWWSTLNVDSLEHNIGMLFISILLILVYYFNSSVNFLLYCFSGKQFRQAVKKTLFCKGGRAPVYTNHAQAVSVIPNREAI